MLARLAAAADSESAIRLKDGPGRELTAGHCALCHSLDYIPANAAAMDRAGWQKTLQKMRERFGAPLSDEEARAILDYLATRYAGKS
jgi:mono/diheme cytochrome c family protein